MTLAFYLQSPIRGSPGGSLSPPKLPPVAPREDLTGQTLAGALVLASVVDPKTCDATQDKLMALGQQVAGGQSKKASTAG